YCNRPEHPYCSRKVILLFNFLSSTRIAGGFLSRFAQLPKGMKATPGAVQRAASGTKSVDRVWVY
ncbi:MAG: hypothetical protein PHY64_13200, partial [Eubacteriales bacterium]|nr:hypothetical protein [Eubacteriales bacterium]